MLLLGILSVFFVSTLAVAESGVAPLGIVPAPIPGGLTVTIATDKPSYVIGESVTITYAVSQAAYIYIIDIQPNGFTQQIFPNNIFPGGSYNYVQAGQYTLGGSWRIAPPLGTEQLQIIASPVPLNLAPTPYGQPFPMIGSTPSAAALSIQAQIKGIIPEPQWATAWTSFTILAAYTPPAPPSGYYYFYPPFIGFPGGTWYWQNGQWNYGIPAEGIYWYFGADGKWHLRISFHLNFGG
jgi:hypothetical protein